MKYFTELNSRMEGTIEECENPKGFEKVITYHKLSSGLAELLKRVLCSRKQNLKSRLVQIFTTFFKILKFFFIPVVRIYIAKLWLETET